MIEKKITAFGRYPVIKANVIEPQQKESVEKAIREFTESFIPFGNGRSYGDSALSENILVARGLDRFLGFDEESGTLHVEAGVLLSEILDIFVPRGWFLKITPGTKLITVGGAIASDVHGKNHHKDGCFSEAVKEFNLLLPSGKVIRCSREENRELFLASCGGMGLTGVILDAKIELCRIRSTYIEQKIIKTKNLEDTFEAFEEYKNYPYSVAWIDCLTGGVGIGRSVLMLGRFSEDGRLDWRPKRRLNIPCDFPSFVLNSYSVKLFNKLYYRTADAGDSKVHLDEFFYPLDWINNWNRMYGRKGFLQYQFILPKELSYKGINEILYEIRRESKGSFLAILKLYGKENENYLSFPIEGYSLAMDFKREGNIFDFLDRLDKIVVKYNGRIYLTKDARASRSIIEAGYPKIGLFRKIREEYGLSSRIQSLQSRRVGL